MAAVTLAVLIGVPSSVRADDVERASEDAGLGLATVLANVFYVPVKVGYAAVGGLTGGLAWALTGGSRSVAERIWVPAVGGDYVLSSEMVSGSEAIEFSGTADPDM
ncbi:MAG: hypothetical protein ACE5D3_07675 [Candidatus Binatia bacterium]